jgi:uncharacterized protein YdeI (BOF family)
MKATVMNLLLGFALAGALNATVVQAQTAIRDLQRTAPTLTIAGTVRSVVGNEFILDDGTGQLIVDAGPRWYHSVNLSEGEQVTVVGEYDDYDFDAYRITRANGETITIREGSGPPPWAGGRGERRN